MKRFLLTVSGLLTAVIALCAGKVEKVVVQSPSMKTGIDNLVILPENYSAAKPYPVLYLLNGFGGNQESWLKIRPDLPQIATDREIIIVCPDGNNSWYWDSPAKPAMRYETYMSQELTAYIDKHYSTRAEAAGRAVTGLSMGGHGGLWLGIRHPNVFGACGSTSGGVDIRPFPDNWQMKELLGDYDKDPQVWDDHTVINQLWRIKPGTPAIIVDCGTEDFFYEVNCKLHEQMLYRNIKHDFITRPGAHNAQYWKNSILYQILFFDEFFDKAAQAPAKK